MLHIILLAGLVTSQTIFTSSSMVDGMFEYINYKSTPLSPKPAQPYSSMTLLLNGTVVADYGINNGVIIHDILVHTYAKRRADFRQPITIDLATVESTNTTGSRNGYIEIDYTRQNDSVLSAAYVHLSVFGTGIFVPMSPVIKTLTVGAFSYSKTRSTVFVVSGIGVSYSGTFDVDSFLADCVASGGLSPLDEITNIRIMRISGVGGGVSWTDLRLTYGNVDYRNPENISGFIFSKEIAFSNSASTDYCNFSGPAFPISSLQTSLTFLYANASNKKLKCSLSCRAGYLNGTFYTPIGNYGLPINLSVDYEFRLSFSFVHALQFNGASSTTLVSAVGCFVLSTRTDYNSSTFTNPSTVPTREIYICPFWTPAYLRQGAFIRNVTYEDSPSGTAATYQQYMTTNSKTNSAPWPAHYFYADTPVAKVTDFDVYCFVRSFKINSAFLPNEMISGASFGLFIYSGYASFSNLSVSLTPPILYVPKCSLSEYMSTSKSCKIDSQLFTSANFIASIPSLTLFVSVRDLLAFVDDFAYFPYHQPVNSPRFSAFCKLMWNITNAKWLPMQILGTYDTITNSFTKSFMSGVTNESNRNVPAQWINLGEGSYFVSNTSDYWVIFLPINIVLFIVVHYGRLLFKKCPKIQETMSGFKYFLFILAPLVIDNIQNLAFRVGLQYRNLAVGGASFQYINLVVAHSILFIILAIALSQYILLFRMAGHGIIAVWQMYTPCKKTIYYTMILLCTRFFCGIAHSFLYNWPVAQIYTLTIAQLILLISNIYFRKIFRSRFSCYFYVQEYALRTALFLLLCFQVHESKTGPNPTRQDYIMVLLIGITFTCVTRILSWYFVTLPCASFHKQQPQSEGLDETYKQGPNTSHKDLTLRKKKVCSIVGRHDAPTSLQSSPDTLRVFPVHKGKFATLKLLFAKKTKPVIEESPQTD